MRAKVHKAEEKLHKQEEKLHKRDKKLHKEAEKMHKREEKKHHSSHKSKKITIAKGVKVKRGVEEKMRRKKGSGSAGKYKTVSPKKFVGKSGGASKYSFPIDTLARARNALARAHFAPNPAGIKAAVYRKYPELKKRAMARGKLKGK